METIMMDEPKELQMETIMMDEPKELQTETIMMDEPKELQTETIMMDEYISKKETCRITSQSATSIWRKWNDGSFPAPRQIGPARIGFLKSEVANWMQTRPVAIKKQLKLKSHHRSL